MHKSIENRFLSCEKRERTVSNFNQELIFLNSLVAGPTPTSLLMHSHTPLLPQGPLQCQVTPGPGKTFCWQLLEIAEVSREEEKVEVTWQDRTG